MFRFLLVISLIVCGYGGSLPLEPRFVMDLQRDERIIGGQEVLTNISEIPYLVAMLYSSNPSGTFGVSCGGSLISVNHVLCVAHCPDGTSPQNWKIRAGSSSGLSGGEYRNVHTIYQHEAYDWWIIDNDVSIYVVDIPILESSLIKPIALPIQGQFIPDRSKGVIGWFSNSGFIQTINVQTVNQDVCRVIYQSICPITNGMLCADFYPGSNQDFCQGTSGSPLAINGVVMGITSLAGCGRTNYPGIWTRVPTYSNWIRDKLTRL